MVDYRDFYRELRTDWLKLRGQVFDAHTRLPALPAVIDHVRRRLEAGERMGMIYLDPGSCDRLEPACGWQAYDQLIQSIGEALRDHSVAHLGERDRVALAAVRSAEFVIFVGLSGDGAEPAAALESSWLYQRK